MRKTALVFFLLLLSLALRAQTTRYTISGNVFDEKDTPIPFANIALFANADSSLVGGTVSDDQGKYELQAEPGNYYIRISFLSYGEKIINNVRVLSGNLNLGNTRLEPSSQVLEEVTVQADKTQMELYLDKRVFNIGKDLANVSGSAGDILDRVPSVTVDVDGNVSLRGSQNVRILIDGKPSGLTGINTATALRQLQGNLIESIEVITNPSARYDAEGEVGIINIILKKNLKKGVNGAFSANVGHPTNYGASFNMNMRRKNINFFSSYGISTRVGPGQGSSFQRFTTADTTFSYFQGNRRERGDVSHNFRLGADVYFSETSVLTGAYLLRKSNSLNKTYLNFLDYDENDNLVRTVLRDEREDEPGTDTEFSLSYRKELNGKGHVLTADLKYILNDELELSEFIERDDTAPDDILQRSSNKEYEQNYLFQTDYTRTFAKKGKIEAGLKSTRRIIENVFLVEEQISEENWTTVGDFDNSLTYTELIQAGYFIVGNEVNKFSYQLGLRSELTDIKVDILKSDAVTKQNYLNFFPSTHFSYKLNDTNTVQVSYSYRLSRPGFRDLLPFSNYSNRRSLRVGNPALRPEYTHSLETSYLVNSEKGSILSSVYYRYRTGVINRITIVDSVGYNSWYPINMATENAYGFEFNLSYNPTDWLTTNLNGNFYRAITDGTYEGQSLHRDTYTWNGRGMARARFLKFYDFQASMFYRAPQNTTQGRSLSMYAVDLGLSRDILNGNGTLTLSVRDLFNTRKWRNIVDQPEFYSTNEFQWRSRQMLLTFTYRLNRKKEPAREREGNEEREGQGQEGQSQGEF